MDSVRAALLDRDGTVIVEKDHAWRIEDYEPIPGSLEALRLLTERDVKIYIVTNQAGIAKGCYTETEFQAFNDFMLADFGRHGIRIKRVLHCPHHPDGIVPRYAVACRCRKPATGLLEAALADGHLRPEETVLIGDKNSDIDAGHALGVTTYLVLTGYGAKQRAQTRADFVATNCLSAVRHVLFGDGDGVC